MNASVTTPDTIAIIAGAQASAYRPIALAVARYAAADDVRRRHLDLVATARAVARTIGCLALAARAQFGAAEGEQSGDVLSLLGQLRRRELTDANWLELSVLVLSPWEGRGDEHPIAPLARLFSKGSMLPQSLRSILTSAQRADLSPDAAADEFDAILLEEVALLAVILRELDALCGEAALVLCHIGAVTRLHGAEADPTQSPEPLTSDVLAPPGQLALLLADAERPRCIALDPLLRLVGDDVLLLHGGRSGDLLLRSEAGHAEQVERDGWLRLGARLEMSAEGAEGIAAADPDGPFRKLRCFESKDRHLFFGRKKQVDEVCEVLADHALLTIFGASGAGKSSFVRAGLAPRLEEAPIQGKRRRAASSWRCAVMVPGLHPLNALQAALTEVTRTWAGSSGTGDAIQTGGAALVDHLARFSEAAGVGVVLIIDQCEELFIQGASPEEVRTFTGLIVAMAADDDGPTRVVVCVRADYLSRFKELPGIHAVFEDGVGRRPYPLDLPGPDDLRLTLTEPVRRMGFAFEDDELVESMVKEVEGRPAALLLLQVAAARMWRERDRTFNRLTWSSYRGMGQVTGASASVAEGVYLKLPPAQRGATRRIFLRLYTEQGDRRSGVSRAAILAEAQVGPGEEVVLDHLLVERLVVVRNVGDQPEPTIELSHEALKDHWPRLSEWLQDTRDDRQQLQRLTEAARQWDTQRRDVGLLWRGRPLEYCLAWQARTQPTLSALQAAFLRASLAEARRQRRARNALAALVGLLLAALAMVVWAEWREAVYARQRSNELARRVLHDMRDPLRSVGRMDVLQKALDAMESHDNARRGSNTWLADLESYFDVQPEAQELRLRMEYLVQRAEIAGADGRVPERVRLLGEAVRIGEGGTARFPDDEELLVDYICVLGRYGGAKSASGHRGDGDPFTARALDIARQRHRALPHNRRWLREVAVTLTNRHNNWGSPQAIQALREALTIYAQLAAEQPNRAEVRRELAVAHGNLASALGGGSQPQEAITEYRAAYAAYGAPTPEHPADFATARDAADMLHHLGHTLEATSDRVGATEAMRRAAAIYDVVGFDNGDFDLLVKVQHVREHLARYSLLMREFNDAERYANEAIQLSHRIRLGFSTRYPHSDAPDLLAWAYVTLTRVSQARAELDNASAALARGNEVCAAGAICSEGTRRWLRQRGAVVAAQRGDCAQAAEQTLANMLDLGSKRRDADDSALGYQRAGDVQRLCAHPEEALRHYERALEFWTVAANRGRLGWTDHLRRIETTEHAGYLLLEVGSAAAGEARLRQALVAIGEQLRHDASSPDLLSVRAHAQWRLAGSLLRSAGGRSEGRALLTQALETLRALRDGHRATQEELGWIPEIERLTSRRSHRH